MAIRADRGGRKSNNWYQRDLPVTIATHDRKLEFWLALDSKGGGVTDIRIEVEKDSYEELLYAMLQSDFDKTLRSFATACQKWRRTNTQ